jgi:hypothetical protein
MNLFAEGTSVTEVTLGLDAILQELQSAPCPDRPQNPAPRRENSDGIAYRRLVERFGEPLPKGKLYCLAVLIRRAIPTIRELDRQEKRNRDLLVGWFESHWPLIEPILEEFGED